MTAEAGAGKTRLAAEFGRRRPDAIILAGRCSPRPAAAPSPIAGAVQELLGLAEGCRRPWPIARCGASPTGWSGRAGPRLSAGSSCCWAPPTPTGCGPGRGRRAGDAGARAVLEGLAREGPVIAVVDDLHWADAQLLELLRTTPRQPWSGPVLFLGLSRPAALEGEARCRPSSWGRSPSNSCGSWASWPSAPERRPRSLTGSPAAPPGTRCSWRRASACWWSRAPWSAGRGMGGGRPPASGPGAGHHPDPDRGPAGRPAAWREAGAPGCRRLRRGHLGPAAGSHLAGGDIRSAIRLVQRGLLRRGRTPGTRSQEYGFKHVLIREVAYESMPRRDRSDRHLRVATWLRDAGLTEEPVAELAYHYEQAWRLSRSGAAQPGDRELAVLAARYLGRLADRTLTYQARRPSRCTAGPSTPPRRPPVRTPGSSPAALGRAESLIELGRHHEAAGPAKARDLAQRRRRAPGGAGGARPRAHRVRRRR